MTALWETEASPFHSSSQFHYIHEKSHGCVCKVSLRNSSERCFQCLCKYLKIMTTANHNLLLSAFSIKWKYIKTQELFWYSEFKTGVKVYIYCIVIYLIPDISLFFNEWDQKKKQNRKTWEDSSAESIGNAGGMKIAGIQPLSLCDLRQAISFCWPPYLKREEDFQL